LRIQLGQLGNPFALIEVLNAPGHPVLFESGRIRRRDGLKYRSSTVSGILKPDRGWLKPKTKNLRATLAGNSLYDSVIHLKIRLHEWELAMSRFESWLLFLLLALTTLGVVGCGSSRQLQSVTISPASADAQNFSAGQVSFTATGTFQQKPIASKTYE
jgi:hypothetical protein